MQINSKGVTVDTDTLTFRKSSFSNASGCVEVAEVDGHFFVRDSKDPSGPVLHFEPNEWTSFKAGVAFGEF